MEAGLLIKLFLTFAKIGLVGFGGGMAILPLIYQSVSEFNAIDADEFADLFAISQATPGPLAVNAATFSGFETAGIPGAIAATLGVAFPAFILVALCVRIRPVAVGMIMAGFVMMAETTLLSGSLPDVGSIGQLLEIVKPVQVLMVIATFVAAQKFKVGAIKLIMIMGVLGAFLCKGELL